MDDKEFKRLYCTCNDENNSNTHKINKYKTAAYYGTGTLAAAGEKINFNNKFHEIFFIKLKCFQN